MKYHPSHLSIRISADIAFVITTLDPLPCSPIRWISLCRLQIQRDATLCNSFQISCHTASHIMRPPSPYVLTNAGRPSLSAIFRPLRQLPPVCCFPSITASTSPQPSAIRKAALSSHDFWFPLLFRVSVHQPSPFCHPECFFQQPQPQLLIPRIHEINRLLACFILHLEVNV